MVLRFRGDVEDGEVETMLQFRVRLYFSLVLLDSKSSQSSRSSKNSLASYREVIDIERALEVFCPPKKAFFVKVFCLYKHTQILKCHAVLS